jgi:hypothetical protein
LGQDGNAQLAEGLQMADIGDAGEREKMDEVVEGGDGNDFKGIRIGFTHANGGEGVDEVEEVGEGDMALMWWVDNMNEVWGWSMIDPNGFSWR